MAVLSRKLIQEIQIAGRSEAPVLLTGETGTGKEVAAREIHAIRTRGPFVEVNCGAITPTLIEAELFGSVRGAYTGADRDRKGLVEEANGGTLFLDEIGDLPMDMQVKLLRVLQEKTFRKVGSTTQLKSNFRLVAATWRDLEKEIQQGNFRQDLYYRLNVLHIHIPPLRERRDEIPALVDHFRDLYADPHQAQPQISASVLKALFEYHWPGNVRELANVVERCLARVSGPMITLTDLPEQMAYSQLWTNAQTFAAWEQQSKPLSLAEAERLAIEDAMKRAQNSTTEAAAILGISRTTLWRKLREMGKTDNISIAK